MSNMFFVNHPIINRILWQGVGVKVPFKFYLSSAVPLGPIIASKPGSTRAFSGTVSDVMMP